MKLIESELPEGITPCKKAYLRAIGLKKRDRKKKGHIFNFGYYSTDTTCESLVNSAKDFILKEMKDCGGKFEIVLNNHEIEMRDNMKIERFSFDDLYNNDILVVHL